MPRYINKSQSPVYVGSTVLPSNVEVSTLDVITNNRAYIISSNAETYNITLSSTDKLAIRFNSETSWTVITLTAGLARTAAQVVSDINTGYGSTVAYDEGGKIKLIAPDSSDTISAIYISESATNSSSKTILGFNTVASDKNPVSLFTDRAFVNSTNYSTYNITTSNNKFIFKFNNEMEWVTVELTTGAARTSSEIASEINIAYQKATTKINPIAYSVETVTGSGNYMVQIKALLMDNYNSSVWIKNTLNTANSVLGFTGKNYEPVKMSGLPFVKTLETLPLFNPIVAETLLTFAAAGSKYFYLTNPLITRIIEFIRPSGEFNIYIEDATNTPPMTMTVGEILTLTVTNKFNKFIIVTDSANSITIRELKE